MFETSFKVELDFDIELKNNRFVREKGNITKCRSFGAKCVIFESCVKFFSFIMLGEGGVGIIIYCQYLY